MESNDNMEPNLDVNPSLLNPDLDQHFDQCSGSSSGSCSGTNLHDGQDIPVLTFFIDKTPMNLQEYDLQLKQDFAPESIGLETMMQRDYTQPSVSAFVPPPPPVAVPVAGPAPAPVPVPVPVPPPHNNMFYQDASLEFEWDDSIEPQVADCLPHAVKALHHNYVFVAHGGFKNLLKWPAHLIGTGIVCYNDGCPFDTMPFPLPVSFNEITKKWVLRALVTCSTNCMKRTIKTEMPLIAQYKIDLFNRFCREIFHIYDTGELAPPRSMLWFNMGPIKTIAAFRTSSKSIVYETCDFPFQIQELFYAGKPIKKKNRNRRKGNQSTLAAPNVNADDNTIKNLMTDLDTLVIHPSHIIKQEQDDTQTIGLSLSGMNPTNPTFSLFPPIVRLQYEQQLQLTKLQREHTLQRERLLAEQRSSQGSDSHREVPGEEQCDDDNDNDNDPVQNENNGAVQQTKDKDDQLHNTMADSSFVQFIQNYKPPVELVSIQPSTTHTAPSVSLNSSIIVDSGDVNSSSIVGLDGDGTPLLGEAAAGGKGGGGTKNGKRTPRKPGPPKAPKIPKPPKVPKPRAPRPPKPPPPPKPPKIPKEPKPRKPRKLSVKAQQEESKREQVALLESSIEPPPPPPIISIVPDSVVNQMSLKSESLSQQVPVQEQVQIQVSVQEQVQQDIVPHRVEPCLDSLSLVAPVSLLPIVPMFSLGKFFAN
jgi:hypothetical protein